MSNQFSLPRFGRLFRKHTAEYGKSYLLGVGVLLGLLALLMGLQTLQSKPFGPGQQAAFLGIFLIMGGAVFTSSIFAGLAEKKQGMAILMLPASHLEKYLVGWLYSFVVFTLVCVGCFYLVAVVIVNADDWHGQPPQLLNLFDPEYNMGALVLGYAFIHAIFIWGALFFQKLHLVRTAFAVFVGAGLLLFANFQVVKLLLGHVVSEMVLPFSGADLALGKEHYRLYVSPAQEKLVKLVPVAMTLLLWVAAYFRVQEKEI
ncbi:hypothetical protein [Hymenobacter algoricola]|uniref:ABC transporter permease n=1 Tax=Hymenobacter algoricola TaxID=486267 RepID=A0ABP7N2F2_9BACT